MKKINISDDDAINVGNKIISEFMNCSEPQDYHISWDLLMGVIEKVEGTWDNFHGYFGVHLSSNSCTIQGSKLRLNKENPHYAYNDQTYEKNKITAAWISLVEFIKWYNDNIKK